MDFREDLATRQLGAVGATREAADVARAVLLVRRAGVGDIEVFLVGREGDAVRANHIGDDGGDRAGFGVDAIDVAALDLLCGAIAFVVGVDAVGGSVNQIESSDFTTTSLGEFRRLPFQFRR